MLHYRKPRRLPLRFEYISEIKSTGNRTLQVTLKPSQINTGMVKNFLAEIKIIPKHIWHERQILGPLSGFIETSPVGSGTYKLLTYSNERIVLIRNDGYWGQAIFGLPAPKYTFTDNV
jgi:peptide/nickel transport system substrate-binding protein